MGLLSTLFGQRPRRLAKAPRRTQVEAVEPRRMMAADVILGSVYFEEATGDDTQADTLQVAFEGGAAGTTLDRLTIDGDKRILVTGFEPGDGRNGDDAFFDIDPADPGSFDPVDFSIVSSEGFEITGYTIEDGGTAVTFTFSGFDAGEKLVFAVDVDETSSVGGTITGATPVVEGAEFQYSVMIGEFSAPGFVDLRLAANYFDAFDDNFTAAESAAASTLDQLPGDNYGGDFIDRTAGAVAHAPQLELATLSGYVYHDRDDDGVRDAGEEPIPGVTLTLVDSNGVRTGETATTNAEGYYEFVDLEEGTYSVRETQPDGWFDGKDTIGSEGGNVANDLLSNISLVYGDKAVNYNFGELLAGSIAGRVHASNGPDCDYDNPDILLAGVTIELLSLQGVVLETTTTDSQGRYSFTGLRPGEYQVREQQPEGYYDGSERAGSEGGTLADDLISGIVIGSDVDAVNYDFCEHIGANLSGYVYHDRSNDGIRDNGEEPIAGVTLKLLLDDGTDTGRTAVTDSDGFYQFTNLDRGKYRVMEIHPEGWIDGKDTAGTEGGLADNPGDMIREIMLDYGDDAREYNFGELLPASIAGRVHASPDGDCDFDNPGTPIEGVTIQLLDAAGNVLETTQTNAAGEYRFDDLAPGEYQVRELQPAGYFDGGERAGTAGGVLSSNDVISAIQLGSDVNAVNYDFCEHVGASLSGYVYHDRSDDGIKDPSEDPIAGVRVELLDAAGVATGQFTTTDAAGYYEFTGLDAGVYSVREVQPVGWFDGKDTAGSNGGLATNDLISTIPLEHGDAATDYNFGELLAASISGRVHANDGPDCDYENPDVLLSGVVIELLDPSGNVLATTTTDSLGRYTFGGLQPGEYQVREQQPEGYYDGSERVGSAGGTLADDLLSGIVVGSEEAATGYDFCEHIGADLSGYVYHDRDNDGLREPGEEPIPGVELKLLLEDGTDTGRRAVTDSSGFYQFTNLDRGKYRVMEIHPEGWIDGKDTAGTEGGFADNPGDMIREIMLDYGDDAREYNFGELLPGSIAGSVHSSPDGDCTDDENAMPIAGVTIELLDDTGAVIRTTQTDAEGRYLFDGLAPGSYSVREVQPASHFDGVDHLGSVGGLVSDDLFSQIVIGSDVDAVNYDFCEVPAAALSGYVFVDGPAIFTAGGVIPENYLDGKDGLRTADDRPLAGVVVRLVNDTNGLPLYALRPGETLDDVPEGFAGIEVLPGTYSERLLETVTDARGYYEFRHLPSGSYSVVEVQPSGLLDGIDTPGSTGGVAYNPTADGMIPIGIHRQFGRDQLNGVSLSPGDFSVENNFSEVDTFTGWLPPETPELPPTFTPRPPITPGTRPLPLPPAIPERAPEDFIGGSEAIGFTWHLSVINGGTPREMVAGSKPTQFVSQTTDPAWQGVERDAAELRRAKWQLLASDELDGAELSELLFGSEDAIPVAGDWNGDGIADIGVFIDGDWYLDLDGDGRWSAGDLWAQLGSEDDLPVTGDWDGDGKTDIGIYGPAWPRDPHAIEREPGMPDVANWPGPIAEKAKNVPPTEEDATSGARLLAKLRASIGQRRTDRIDHVFHYGTPGDAPVVGDWNGDGIRTIGVFRDGQWNLDTDGDGRFTEADRSLALGQTGDTPIVGDFNGDGIDDLGVFRGGQWLVDPDGDGVLEPMNLAAQDQALADAGGKPVVGDWDGDGRDEAALFSPAETPDVERISARDDGTVTR